MNRAVHLSYIFINVKQITLIVTRVEAPSTYPISPHVYEEFYHISQTMYCILFSSLACSLSLDMVTGCFQP